MTHIYVSCCALIFITAGCNDRVFIEPLPSPAELAINPLGDTIVYDAGVGGAESMTVTTSHAASSAVNAIICELSENGDTVGYLTEAYVSLPGGLAITTDSYRFRALATEKGALAIITGQSFDTVATRLSINLHYQYGTLSLPLAINPIQPFKAVAISYPYSLAIAPAERDEHVSSSRYINNGNDTIMAVIYPYQSAETRVRFEASSSSFPTAAGEPVEIPTVEPGSEDATPGLYGFKVPYIPWQERTYPSGGRETSIRVSIPPHSSRRVHIFLHRAIVTAYYRVRLQSPSLRETIETEGNVWVDTPTGFIIGYNDDILEP
ncbi:MAG: hypothetical protein NC342_06820 [Pseudoflavonifractor sp.]|nr:hypothetical protein [Alloprevotella sp.]MCM1117230.1 hypothetical protein [Pseudoflavonifractor sp.]